MGDIDISLASVDCDLAKFTEFKTTLPTLFLGFVIKNEYDNQRLTISEKYKPTKQVFLFERTNETCSLLPLYGTYFKLNKTGRELASVLLQEDLDRDMDLKKYQNILFEYKVTCNDYYSYLNKRIYPIDFKCLEKITDNENAKDPKILQHLLQLDENKFDFHKFGAFKLLILA
tara:strand:+ start:1435 stop:1953 length:519 start_codon:yes stop_codon:yes gene_type:complete